MIRERGKKSLLDRGFTEKEETKTQKRRIKGKKWNTGRGGASKAGAAKHRLKKRKDFASKLVNAKGSKMSRTTCQKSLTRTAGYLVVSLLPHPLCSQSVSRTRPSTGSRFSITSSTLLHVQAAHAKTTPKRQRTQKKKTPRVKKRNSEDGK